MLLAYVETYYLFQQCVHNHQPLDGERSSVIMRAAWMFILCANIVEHDRSELGRCSPNETLTEGYECTQVTGDLEIIGSGVPLHNLKNIIHVDGKIKIQDTDVDSFNFPMLISIGKPYLAEPVLMVIDNPQLTSISFPKLEKAETGSEKLIMVRGNKGFKNADSLYKQFSKVSSDKTLEIECFPDKEITDLSELNGCTMIGGDLILKGTSGETYSKITHIFGCLKMHDTSLKDLSFFNLSRTSVCSGELHITGNKGLCFSIQFLLALREILGGAIRYLPHPSCDTGCTLDEFKLYISCKLWDGDLHITGQDSNNDQGNGLKEVMDQVKRITGKLIISGNASATIKFHNLISVGNSSSTEEAILIDGNANLKEVSIPKLKNVETGGNVAIVAKGYKMTKDQAKFLKQVVGDKKFKLECDFSNEEVKEFSELDYCTSVKGDLLLKNTQGVLNTKIESIGGCLRVIDTDLNEDMFESLVSPLESETCQSGEKSEIKGNKNLCLVWSKMKAVKNTFGRPVGYSFDESCEMSCVQEEIAEEGSYCTHINGILQIDAVTAFDHRRFTLIERIDGGLRIKDRSLSSLEEIFPKLKKISSSEIPLLLENVENYSNVTELVQFSLESQNTDGLLIKITTNQEIPYMVDADLKAHFGSKRVELSKVAHIPEGVCVLVDPAVEVKNCKTVEGDFILDEKTASVSTDLTEITGCLVVQNSTIENYEFLTKIEKIGDKCRWNSGETDISNNSCISFEIRRNTSGKIRELVESKENQKKCYECNGGILPDQECKVIIGDLQINQAFTPELENQLEDVKEIYGRLIIKNSVLPQISLTQLTKIEAPESEEEAISIDGNENLKEISIPKLKYVRTGGTVAIVVNGYKMTKDKAKILKEIAGDKEFNQEHVYGGLFVKDCSPSNLEDKSRNSSSSGFFYMVFGDIKACFGSNRIEMSKVEQSPDGVCVFIDPAVEVKNCKTVEGDLILSENTVSVFPHLTEITGCLVVQNTKMENYEFMTKIEKVGEKCRWNDGETNISNNSCIPYEVRRKTSGKVKELVESEENKKYCYECTGAILPGQKCKVIVGDLEVNQASTPELVNQLEGVKEIYGRLIIKNSVLPQISLAQLTKIEASESEEPAIEITGNNELTSLQMPALVNATSKGQVVVKIEENKKLKKTAELTEQLGKATGSECGEGKAGACQFSQVKEPEKVTATKSKENTTEEEGVSKTVLIVLGVIGAILLVLGLAGVAVIVVLIKKKGAKKAKKGKGPGQPPKSTMSKVDSKNLPTGEEKTSKTKSMAVEKGTKSLSDKKKTVSKEATKEEASKEKKENEAPGGPSDENVPAPVPNAS